MLHRLRTAAGAPQASRHSAALYRLSNTLSMGENHGAVSVPAIADGGPDNGSRPKGAASAAGTKKGLSKAKSGTAPVSQRDQVYLDAILQKRIRMFEEIQAQQAAARASVGGEAIRITFPDGTVKEGKKLISTPMDEAKEISSGLAANALISQEHPTQNQMTMSGEAHLLIMQPQQPPQPPHHPMPGAVPPHLSLANITTEQIQKYLDENKQLILAILDNQNLGKLSECAQYQAQLQKNLLYLAAIADAQPQIPAVRAQMLPHPAMQQAGHYMQQAPIFPPRPSMPFNPQQMQQQQQTQTLLPPQHQFHQITQLPVQVHMDMRPGMDNGMHAMHTEATFGMNNGLPTTSLSEFPKGATAGGSSDGRGNKQDANAGAELASSDGHRTSVNEHGSGDKEPSLQKRLQEGQTP